jgi:hypothetical protein
MSISQSPRWRRIKPSWRQRFPQSRRCVFHQLCIGAARARTGTWVTTLTPDDYKSIRRAVQLFLRSSAYSTRSFLVKAGDLSKNNCVIAGVEPDYRTIGEWGTRDGEALRAADLRPRARTSFCKSSKSMALSVVGCAAGLVVAAVVSALLARWVGQPGVFDQVSAKLAVTVATALNLCFAAVPARGAARLDPIQALRCE